MIVSVRIRVPAEQSSAAACGWYHNSNNITSQKCCCRSSVSAAKSHISLGGKKNKTKNVERRTSLCHLFETLFCCLATEMGDVNEKEERGKQRTESCWRQTECKYTLVRPYSRFQPYYPVWFGFTWTLYIYSTVVVFAFTAWMLALVLCFCANAFGMWLQKISHENCWQWWWHTRTLLACA